MLKASSSPVPHHQLAGLREEWQAGKQLDADHRMNGEKERMNNKNLGLVLRIQLAAFRNSLCGGALLPMCLLN